MSPSRLTSTVRSDFPEGFTDYQQIQKWNNYQVRPTECHAIHVLIHEIATSHPHHPAVHACDGTATFADLDKLSTRLAAYLQERQIGPGDFVAVCFDKSLWAIVTFLAVNKTGAAFVPLDPNSPSQRNATIIRQTKAVALLTSSSCEDMPADTISTRMAVSGAMIDQCPPVTFFQPVMPRSTDIAYCLFTSGSTGAPRGCLVSHSALASISNHAAPLRLNEASRTLQFAPFTFGISMIEIWCTLTAGGTVCIPSHDDRQSRLALVIQGMDVNWALMTPTTTQIIDPREVPCLQTLGIAGEPLPRAQIEVWASEVHLFQAYGLTEWAGICAVSPRVQHVKCRATIGHAAGGRFWIVDLNDHHTLSPIGAEGELVIEGPSLATGYLNEPEKTADVFIPPPAWRLAMESADGHPTRLYKTGDVVRYTSDGGLEYISRKGTQVKLRGQRIELNEVEYHISQRISGIKKVIAEIVQPNGPSGQPTLGAFLVPAAESDSSWAPSDASNPPAMWFYTADEALRSSINAVSEGLKNCLPSYMLPQLFLPLKQLPVTASGKVDRRKLREIVTQCQREQLLALTQTRAAIIPPCTDAERLVHGWVVQICQLSPDRVGMADDFFALGGDSALAMKFVALASRNGAQCTVADVFRRPALQQLAELIEENCREPLPTAPASYEPFHLLRQSFGDTGLQSLLSKAAEHCGVTSDEIEEMYPCTPMQESLVALSAVRQGAGLACFEYHLQPHVDIARLRASWQTIMQTNPILRTRIVSLESRMVQVVLRPRHSAFDIVVEEDLDWWQPLKPDGKMLMATFEKLDEGATKFIITVHHALCDRWSMNNIFQQLETVYCHETVPSAPSYAVFVASVVAQRKSEKTREYWESQLSGTSHEPFPPVPMSYRPKPTRQLESLTQLPASIPEGTTAASLLHLAWTMVIAANTACDDVVFGTTVSGRGAAMVGIEELTGPTLTIVPLSTQVQRGRSVKQALADMANQFVEMIPFEQVGLQEISQYSEQSAAACRFNNQLVVQPSWELHSRRLISHYNAKAKAVGGFAGSALSLICWLGKDPRQIKLEAIFDEAVLCESEVQQLFDHLTHVLHMAVQHPSSPTDALLEIPGGQLQLLQRWNPWPSHSSSEISVETLLKGRVVELPHAPAVCAWDGDLSYCELDRESSRLALCLRNEGVDAHDIVPILLGRSKWAPVAMWAAIKVGAAFVLLCPDYPAERREGICAAVDSRVVISSIQMVRQASTLDRKIVLVDDAFDDPSPRESTQFRKPPASQRILYVVFTSGSTGTPKGVVIEDRSFCASVQAHNPMHGVDRTSRVLHNASHAFDISIMETLSTLVAGGCVCIPSQERIRSAFVETANDLRITHAFMTPTLVRILDLASVPSLQTIVLGGESLRPSDVLKLRGGSFRVIHEYGPAECSITATAQRAQLLGSERSSKTIGFPLGCRCWVVDPRDPQRLMPIGSVGELIIDGDIVGRGYLNDPERTAASFILPPAWLQQLGSLRQDDARRVYRTGDLVRYRQDGSLEYVGRRDQQVKLRGQRIELGEVETLVQRHGWAAPAWQVAVELAHLGPERVPSLVAFVGPGLHQGSTSSLTSQGPDGANLILPPNETFQSQTHTVLRRLRTSLPAIMIPGLFLIIQRMPLGNTGKIDRRALRAAAEALSIEELRIHRGADTKRIGTPMSHEERFLSGAWASALGVDCDSICPDDHFFQLGGDSLSAMDLVSRCYKGHGVQLTLSQIFNHPILSQQAELLQQKGGPVASDALAAVPDAFSLLGDVRDLVVDTAVNQYQVPRDQIEDIYPCTPLQEGLLAMTARERAAYVAQWLYRLPNNLNLAQLGAAWARVGQAHPILRTRMIQGRDNHLYQVVCRTGPLYHELKTHDEIHDITTQKRLRDQMVMGQPHVDIRVCAAQGSQSPRLLLTMHHANYDRNSMIHVFKDLQAAYYGATDLIARPFSSFVRYVQELDIDEQASYWKQALDAYDGPGFPELPSSTYRPAPSEIIVRKWQLGSATNGQKRGTVTFTTKVYLAWAITQAQYQNAHDVAFGVTVSGRSAPLPGIQEMTGPILATVPFRLRMSMNDTLSALLGATQERRLAASPNEHFGLQNIARCGADAARAAAFQTLLIVQQHSEDADQPHPTLLEMEQSITGWYTFNNNALLLTCTPSKHGQFTVQACFDPQVISVPFTNRVLSLFGDILLLLDQQPTLPLRDVPTLSQEDQSQIFSWNSHMLPPTVHHCVHDLILEHCTRAPEAPAVCAWDGGFTYGELDRLSSNLAAHLAWHGVRPDSLVPLYFEKSRWTTVAILAVLKAGGAFVLLDPHHPMARLQKICEQLDAPVLVVSKKHSTSGSILCKHTVTLGDDCTQWTPSNPEHLSLASNPARMLYVVFTSGSTGQPKGVIIEHGAYATAAHSHIQTLRLSPNSRVLQFSSYAFDVSIMDHLSTLMTGGCVCVPSEVQRRDGMVAALASLQPTHAVLTPSVARAMPELDQLPSSLRTIGLIGEKVQRVDVEKWASRLRLLNTYGPAECSVISTIQDCRASLTQEPSNVGFAAGVACWVVHPNDANRLSPIGVPGELLLQGRPVARGYLGLPEKTSEVFISLPAWLRGHHAGGPFQHYRLYKTGDLVRYSEDGSLIYIGRKDTQAKVRGQRLELSEVEQYVHQCFAGVTEVVAEVAELNGQASLVAFVLCQSIHHASRAASEPSQLLLRGDDEFLAHAANAQSQMRVLLPDYMVPVLFLPLIQIPQAATGKADRKRLRTIAAELTPEEIRTYRMEQSGDGRVQSVSTDAERTLQQVWSQILRLDASTIGAQDHFFALGGDSILAMKAAPMARGQGVNISVADIFDKPRLCDLAALGEKQQATAETLFEETATRFSLSPVRDPRSFLNCLQALRLAPAGSDIVDVFPVTDAQSFFLVRGTVHHYTFSLRGTVDVGRLRAACSAALAKHSTLLTLFTHHDGKLVQAILGSMELPFQHVEGLSDLSGFQTALWESDSSSPNLLAGVPTRFILLSSRDRQQHTFIIRLTHAQWDAVSIPTLFNDIALAYRREPVSESTDFSAFLYQRARQPRDEALQFWRTLLDRSTLAPVPVALSYDSEGSPRTLWENQSIEPSPAAPSGSTLATLVKAAWAYVLWQVRGSVDDDLTFTQTVNGRGLPLKDADSLLGPCLNFLPVRVRMPGADGTVRDLLRQIYDQHLRSMRYEFIDWPDLVRHCTSWPVDTEVQSIVQHQNFDFHYRMPMEGMETSFTLNQNFSPRSELFVFTYPMADRLLVEICVSTAVMSEGRARDLLSRLCRTIDLFARDPDCRICDLGLDSASID